MGPEMVREFQELIDALEADEQVRVVVFGSAVDGYFLNHSDFTAKLEDLTSMPEGSTGLPPWPDFLTRLTRLPVASIALIRGRATGNGSEITLACDMSLASLEKTIISQWEVGVGVVADGGPMARLPRLIGRNRALEVLLSSEDITADQAEAYGYINRALPDANLDAFVDALATRIAKFDKCAIANTKRLVNTSLPPDVELGAGWDACIASLGRPAAQNGIKALMAKGFHKPMSKIASDITLVKSRAKQRRTQVRNSRRQQKQFRKIARWLTLDFALFAKSRVGDRGTVTGGARDGLETVDPVCAAGQR
jgi:enoyl-CoA hydratase/carnithine racemase